MRFGRAIPISTDLVFAARKSVIRDNFQEFDGLSCHFGNLGAQFRLDSRCFEDPKLDGIVVASLNFSRARTSIMQLYPVPVDLYPNLSRAQFSESVVPHLKGWLLQQLGKPETAVLGHEQIIVSWNGATHSYATVKFL